MPPSPSVQAFDVVLSRNITSIFAHNNNVLQFVFKFGTSILLTTGELGGGRTKLLYTDNLEPVNSRSDGQKIKVEDDVTGCGRKAQW